MKTSSLKTGLITLADSTVIEPLVSSWHAWPYIVAPVTSSFYYSRYQRPLLKAFVDDPSLHEETLSQPTGGIQGEGDATLASGSFMSLRSRDVDAVRALADEMERDYVTNAALVEAYTTVQDKLARQSDGLSLSSWYAELPPILRGLVELCYDYRHVAFVRFMEPLTYRSVVYRKEKQALRLSTLTKDSHRAFFMNTPRLAGGDMLQLPMPFDDERLSALFALDRTPAELRVVANALALSEAEAVQLGALCSNPVRPRSMTGVLTYLGHATVLINSNDTTILIDPIIAAKPTSGNAGNRYSFADLPDVIDFVLITHAHYDHFDVETLARLRDRVTTLVVPRANGVFFGDLSLRLIAEQLGYRNVVEVDSFDSLRFADGEIVAVPFLGEHADLPHAKTAYAVRLGRDVSLFGADSDCVDPEIYRSIRAEFGAISRLFLGIEHIGASVAWKYGPLFAKRPTREQNRSRRINSANSERAREIVSLLRPRRFYVYAMGLEPWLRFLWGFQMVSDAPQLVEADKAVQAARALGVDEARILIEPTQLPF